jgi:hypothetical protein
MATPDKFLYDGDGSLLGGMNQALAPSLVPGGQCWNAINVAFRGGKPINRPGFIAQNLSFTQTLAADGTVMATAAQVQAAFTTGKFQGASFYRDGKYEFFFASIGGRLYRLEPGAAGFQVIDMTPDAGNDPTIDIVYFCQCNNILVLQDGQSAPIFVRGANVYRQDFAKHPNQMPIGTFMAYGYGQTVLCIGGGNYVVSDLLGEEPNAPITFNDNHYLATNANFSLPTHFGNVTGIAFASQQDTTTGQGPCLIFGQHGIETLNISLPRGQWQTSQIQVQALTSNGCLGHRSIVGVNGDLWFRSDDGWRSYRQARAQQSGDNQVPQSIPVRPYTDNELPEQLNYASAISINNRLIVTCNPQRSNGGCAHSGLLSLDFDNLTSGLSGAGVAPAWDGYWNGIPAAQLITASFGGHKRAYIFTTAITFNANGSSNIANGLSEIVETASNDVTGFDGSGNQIIVPITSTVETRALNCSPSLGLASMGYMGSMAPWIEKLLTFCEVFEQERIGNTTLNVFFRNDGNFNYSPMVLAGSNETAPIGITLGPGTAISGGVPLYTARNRSYVPADTATGADTRLDRRFYELQAKIVWTGEMQIHRFRIAGTMIPSSRVGGP